MRHAACDTLNTCNMRAALPMGDLSTDSHRCTTVRSGAPVPPLRGKNVHRTIDARNSPQDYKRALESTDSKRFKRVHGP